MFFFSVIGVLLTIIFGLTWWWWGQPIPLLIVYLSIYALTFLISSLKPKMRFLPMQILLCSFISGTFSYIFYKLSIILLELQLANIDRVLGVLYLIVDSSLMIVLVYMLIDAVQAITLINRPHLLSRPSAQMTYHPKVALHVPIHNEPVDIVKATLNALKNIDYPNYEVIVMDNNTTDPDLWKPIEILCKELDFIFHHVEGLKGYKAGALNLALTFTSEDVEVIGVIDADYVVSEDFLSSTLPLLADSEVAFIQTRQGSSNENATSLTRQFSVIFQYFYDVTMVSRNLRNSVIFAGTMGLIRRSVLEEVGGWKEWSLTEDAELSLRILAKGYRGIYLNENFGYGLMPENYVDCRRQWYRWIFGGVQYTLRHLFSILLNPKIPMTIRQRLDYFMGGAFLSMSAGTMVVMSFMYILAVVMLILAGAFNTLTPEFIHNYSLLADITLIYHIYLIMHSITIAMVSSVATGRKLPEAYAGVLSSFSIIIVLARAVINALLQRQSGFIRTPKGNTSYTFMEYLNVIRIELILIGGIILATGLLIVFVPPYPFVLVYLFLGIWQVFIYSSAIWKTIQTTQESHALSNELSSV